MAHSHAVIYYAWWRRNRALAKYGKQCHFRLTKRAKKPLMAFVGERLGVAFVRRCGDAFRLSDLRFVGPFGYRFRSRY